MTKQAMLRCPECGLGMVDVCEMRWLDGLPTTVSTAYCAYCQAKMTEVPELDDDNEN